MLTGTLIFLLVFKTTVGQMNGEFWWLSDKVSEFKGVTKPPLPKFEELSEFDTDESAKIIFRDDNFISTENTFEEAGIIDKTNLIKKSENTFVYPEGDVWPDDVKKPIVPLQDNNKLFSFSTLQTSTPKFIRDKKQDIGDVFIFRYPDDDHITTKYPHKANLMKESSNQNISDIIVKPMSKDHEIELSKPSENGNTNKTRNADLLMFKFPDDNNILPKHTSASPEEAVKPQSNENENIPLANNDDVINALHNDAVTNKAEDSSFSENICSFIIKNECYQRNGVVYTSEKASANQLSNTHLICCILPLSVIDNNRIVFPDSPELQQHRFRRSVKEESANPSLKQRDFILRQKFRPQSTSTKPTGQTKVVTFVDDDYVDPYLNIKGLSMKKQNTASSSKQDCNYPDYVEDYTVELPTPGLVGLYSDNGNRPWSFANGNNNNRPAYGGTLDESDEDDEQSFGYSTVDPRRGSSKSPIRGRPQKITTTIPDDVTYNVESQTVSFQSSPNFQVLQGFKLLNLGRTKNKFYSKTTRRSTTEGSFEDDSKEPEGVSHSGLFQGNLNEQVYENCGKTRKLAEDENSDKQFGNAENGSHPWMALVVLTRRPQGILCYATIVHPRAAVTTGDCIYGRTSPKEVTLIAGLWNLSDRSRIQNRVVTTQLHPQYRAKVLAHDLALLHWKTPLRLNANIQPACLGSAREAEDCKIFGWGGFDQGIRPRSRWQRADILSAQECTTRLSKTLTMPNDAFCATIQSRGTVTGIGGPLICNVNGRKTTAGVAVWRDNALLLLPAQEWIIRAFHDLNIE